MGKCSREKEGPDPAEKCLEGLFLSEILIQGYRPLEGEIKIQGSKNSVLPMLAASILQQGILKFTNVPIIQDVLCMVGILESVGCCCQWEGNSLTVDGAGVCCAEIPQEDVGKMRSSILLMGPLLGRCGRAVTWQPGGCSIGSRPVDLHLRAFSRLGAEVWEDREGKIEASVNELQGNTIFFPFPSVGATENALLAAVLASGTTVIQGAAREPEVISLCQMLRQMGADIFGEGSERIIIRGVKELSGTTVAVVGDRIAAGTYLAAAAAAGGHVRILEAPWEFMQREIQIFRQLGARVEPVYGDGGRTAGIEFWMERRPGAISLSTSPYPGFPTDLQSPMLAVLSRAEGVSYLREKVFEARFKTAEELQKMGAQISVSGSQAEIRGCERLSGAVVKAWDLRGGAALAAAALAAKGETKIENCIHIERGYEDICRDIHLLGGKMEWVRK